MTKPSGENSISLYRDTEMTVPTWWTIFHVFNHNTLHRAEMRQMVAALGGPA